MMPTTAARACFNTGAARFNTKQHIVELRVFRLGVCFCAARCSCCRFVLGLLVCLCVVNIARQRVMNALALEVFAL